MLSLSNSENTDDGSPILKKYKNWRNDKNVPIPRSTQFRWNKSSTRETQKNEIEAVLNTGSCNNQVHILELSSNAGIDSDSTSSLVLEKSSDEDSDDDSDEASLASDQSDLCTDECGISFDGQFDDEAETLAQDYGDCYGSPLATVVSDLLYDNSDIAVTRSVLYNYYEFLY